MSELQNNIQYQGSIDSDSLLQLAYFMENSHSLKDSMKRLKMMFDDVKGIQVAAPQVREWEEREPSLGDHIRVRRNWLYSHHGVYVGNNEVIHFTSSGNDVSSRNRVIKKQSLAEFARGDVVTVLKVAPEKRLLADETVRRAESQLERRGYHLFLFNCEHFANWCVEDRMFSEQVVEAMKKIVLILLATATTATVIYIRKMITEKKSHQEILDELISHEQKDSLKQ